MGKHRTKKEIEDSKLTEAKGKMKIECPYCRHKIHFYAFEDTNKQLCNYCNKYVFKTKRDEFEYRLNEAINKPLNALKTDENRFYIKEQN